MTIILAIESSTAQCSVALREAAGHVTSRAWLGTQLHSENILAEIASLLAQAQLKFSDIGLLLYGAGPGAFTSLRVACGVAQGLSLAWGVPAQGYCSLHALAFASMQARSGNATDATDADASVTAVLDARIGELYITTHREASAAFDMEAVQLLPYGQFDNTVSVVGVLPPELAPAGFANTYPHAASLIAMQQAGLAPLQSGDASSIVPVYVRNKVAQTEAERAASASAK